MQRPRHLPVRRWTWSAPGWAYLAAADAAQLSAATQAECLRELEQAGAVLTAARAFVLAGFTAGQGYSGDAEYSAVSWLIHRHPGVPRSGIPRGPGGPPLTRASWPHWPPGKSPGPDGRLICLWHRLPEKHRDDVRRGPRGRGGLGLGLEELAALFAEMYERARGDLPDQDPDRDFADRGLKLATTFGGAGVMHGDLTPECAELVGRVLDALGAKAGKDDDRTRDQRYHDALAEAMRRLVAAGLLPERAGQPVKAWRTSRWPTCCCSTPTRHCRTSGPRRCGSGGRPAGRSRPRPARRAAPGWTATPPGPSRATRRWPRS